jgi:DNA-binding response OmpR family regulator
MDSIENSRILLVEDHKDLAETIIDFLETLGAIVDYAADGLSGLHLARTERFDVILLDVNLPGMDGIELCHKLREQHGSSVPIMMITARDELNDKLAGFESGADDYLVKPFDLPELVARAHSLIRRNRGRVTVVKLEVADLVLDPATRTVTRQGQNVTLTPAGFQILEQLMTNTPNIVSRDEIEIALWGDEPPASDTLRSQIYKLRQQVDKPFDTALIHTSIKSGYRIIAP